MKNNMVVILFFVLILNLGCTQDGITNIEFEPTDHPISKINEGIVVSIHTLNNSFYIFSADSSKLNCQGNNCRTYYITLLEIKNLVSMLTDTNYFHWEFMTAVTPYPETNCNLFIYGIDKYGNHLDYMCTIGNGEETSRIILELSESLSGEAHLAFIEIANYYKK